MDSAKRLSLVGHFIKTRRTELGISQKMLGQAFAPAVTTQFISNIERGVTPLPPTHVRTLCETLKIAESEIFALLEKDYALKLSGKASHPGEEAVFLSIHPGDYDFLKNFYDAYRSSADDRKKSLRDLILSFPQK